MKTTILIAFTLAALALAETVNYTYDDAGRLIKAVYGSGAVISYTYDKNGNLLSRSVERPESAAPAAKKSAPGQKKTRANGKSR